MTALTLIKNSKTYKFTVGLNTAKSFPLLLARLLELKTPEQTIHHANNCLIILCLTKHDVNRTKGEIGLSINGAS